MDARSRHRQFEDQFLRQLRARAAGLVRGALPADRFNLESVPDGVDGVRATLTRLERFDRGLLEELPGTRAMQYEFRRRVFGPFTKIVARLRAQTLAPIEPLVNGEDPGPVGREQVLDALARYDVLPKSQRPSAAVFASATGFTPEAKALVHNRNDLALILMGGREDGGWDVDMSQTMRQGNWAKLFDLETQDERMKRLLYHLDRSATTLETRGLSVDELAEMLGASPAQTEALVRQACRNDARLMTVVHDGRLHVSRSPLAEESEPMSLRTWIRRLLRMKPTMAERVRAMTEQRVKLEQQRHEVDQRVNALEDEEREAVQRGAAAKTDVERKQMAGRLARTRRELRRLKAQANVFTQQIDILGTHIHHLTLQEQGKRFDLPNAEELTKTAAEAEQITNELAVNADLAAGIEVGAQTPMMAEEEDAILAEFEQAAAVEKPAESTSPEAESSRGEAAPPPPVPDKRERGGESARPEMG